MANGETIRAFAKKFTNLTPNQQQEFERALADIDNSIELTSLETSLDNLRRKTDQNLPIPQITITTSVRGGLVEWPALTDQRINFYEVDVSSTSNFATFTTIPTFGLGAVIDGVTETKFIRVRGVRRDGTTTPYSNVAQLSPRLFDVTTHTAEDFYIPIVGTSANTILGGSGSTLEYTPINPDGNSMVWGFVTIYGNPGIAMTGVDSITVRVKSQILESDAVTPVGGATTLWENSAGEFWSSMAVGPFTVAHPDLNQIIQLRLDVQDLMDLYTQPGGEHTEVFWAHMNIFELGLS